MRRHEVLEACPYGLELFDRERDDFGRWWLFLH